MRLPKDAHTTRPWRLQPLIPDFRLEDVWELRAPGRPDDFRRLVDLFAALDPARSESPLIRALFGLRWKIGERFGWDGPDANPGPTGSTIRDRLPADLRDGPTGPDFAALPFRSLYLLDDEWAAEIANRTMHGILHLGWVVDGDGGPRAQMAVYVRPNGVFGQAYMAAIRPFRYLLYPAGLRLVERRWAAETSRS